MEDRLNMDDMRQEAKNLEVGNVAYDVWFGCQYCPDASVVARRDIKRQYGGVQQRRLTYRSRD